MSEDREKSELDIRVERLILRTERLQVRLKRIRESDDLWQNAKPIKAVFWGLQVLADAVIVRVTDKLFGSFGRKRIHRPPASAINSVARFIYSKRTYERIFMQLVLDLREEHAEALQAKRPRLARWIAMRGNAIMVVTMATHAFTSCGKAVVKIWKLTP
jgi:hypothetical protein